MSNHGICAIVNAEMRKVREKFCRLFLFRASHFVGMERDEDIICLKLGFVDGFFDAGKVGFVCLLHELGFCSGNERQISEDFIFVCRSAVVAFVLFNVILNVHARFVDDLLDCRKIGGVKLHMLDDVQRIDAGATLDARGLLACAHLAHQG